MFRRLIQAFAKPTIAVKRKMSTRYLPNEMPDYSEGDTLDVPKQTIEQQILSYLYEISTNIAATERNGKDGLYLGCSGIAYMYYHLSKVPALSNHKSKFLANAAEYIVPALNVCQAEVNDKDIPAFLFGNCGVYAVATVIYHAMGNKKESAKYRKLYGAAANTCKDINFLPSGSDELFVGRAGYVCGAIWMSKETGTPFKTEDIFDLCRIIVSSGRQYAQTREIRAPLMYSYYDVEYLGAAHGVCSILYMLLAAPGYLDANPHDARSVKLTVDYVLSLQDKSGNFPAALDELDTSSDLIHWCHGAGGVVYLLAKAYLIWNEDKYLIACRSAADLIWEKGLLKKGPGLCHGIAGNAYVFLLLYRLTQESKYLHRAHKFAEFLQTELFKENTREPDNPYSLFEGLAGTNCFLGDLLQPSAAAFPFMDVF